jgi:DUF4097 and DUF4098 domain-containing protein YvlB
MTRLLLKALLLGGLALSATAPADAQRRDRDRDRNDRPTRLDTTLTISRNGIVELEGSSGEMTVSGWNREEVRILATSDGGALRLDATGSRIQLKDIGMGSDDVRYEVSVPTGTRLLLNGRSTDVNVRGTRGDVEVHTQNGDIAIAGAANVDVNALNGDVEVESVDEVRVNLVAGDVRIDSARGPIRAMAVSGDIEMHNAHSRNVTAQTTSGEVFYDGTIDPSGRYDFTSHSGNVTVRVPADVSAAVSLQSYAGEIESDFPITIQGGATISGHPRTFDFRIGNGGARITMTSFSGSVVLERAGSSNPQED